MRWCLACMSSKCMVMTAALWAVWFPMSQRFSELVPRVAIYQIAFSFARCLLASSSTKGTYNGRAMRPWEVVVRNGS